MTTDPTTDSPDVPTPDDVLALGAEAVAELLDDARAVGQRLLEHCVSVIMYCRGDFGAVGHPNDDGASGQGAEVDPNRVSVNRHSDLLRGSPTVTCATQCER